MAHLTRLSGAAKRTWFQSMDRIPNLPSCVIVPDVTAVQWKREAEVFLEGPITTHLVTTHAAMCKAVKTIKAASDKARHLLVITKSQLKVAAKHAATAQSGDGPTNLAFSLFSLYFLAVFADELHLYRNRGGLSSALEALCIRAVVRLGLTATPVPTRLENVLHAARALQINGLTGNEGSQQIQDAEAAHGRISRAAPQGGNLYSGPALEAMSQQAGKVRDILADSMLRRVHNSVDSEGRPLIVLPRLHVETVWITMQDHEKEAVRLANGQPGGMVCADDRTEARSASDLPHLVESPGTGPRGTDGPHTCWIQQVPEAKGGRD